MKKKKLDFIFNNFPVHRTGLWLVIYYALVFDGRKDWNFSEFPYKKRVEHHIFVHGYVTLKQVELIPVTNAPCKPPSLMFQKKKKNEV